LRELLSNYGEITEVWFDGACGEGPNGKKQEYDWDGYYAGIRNLQPNAVIAICGPDVRGVGNENGVARETEWSVQPPELTTESVKSLRWHPAECDVSIRPGWFYHAQEDNKVASLDELLDIYHKSVGRNSVLLLNIPPDRRGLFHENDVRRLRELRKVLDATFKTDLARGAEAKASNVRQNSPQYSPGNIVDGDKNTYWTPDEGVNTATIDFDLGQNRKFNRAVLQEHIKTGQRVEEFSLAAWDGQNWKEFARGTTIGYKRILTFADISAQKIQLRIIKSRLSPTISNFSLFLAPPTREILAAP
jgi:alpha-L-fucosidase